MNAYTFAGDRDRLLALSTRIVRSTKALQLLWKEVPRLPPGAYPRTRFISMPPILDPLDTEPDAAPARTLNTSVDRLDRSTKYMYAHNIMYMNN